MLVSGSVVGLMLCSSFAFFTVGSSGKIERIDLELDSMDPFASAARLQSQEQVVEAENPELAAEFGTSVALGEYGMLVGAHRQGQGQGRVYHFQETPESFTMRLAADFSPASASDSARFGAAIALDGDTAVVAAPLDDGASPQSGAVYIYRNMSGAWFQVQKVFPSNGKLGDRFGFAVALRGDLLAVGAPGVDLRGEDAGAVHWFRADQRGVFQEAPILAPRELREQDGFGKSLAIGETGLAVGAPGTDLDALENAGAMYWFETQRSGWSSSRTYVAQPAQENAQFGRSVAAGDRTVAIGSPGVRRGSQRNVGAVFVYSLEGAGEPSLDHTIVPSRVQADLYFGWSAALDPSGQRIAIGAFGYDEDAVAAGAVSLWTRHGVSAWREDTTLVASDASPRDYLGRSVALFGDQVVAGARGRDVGQALAGAAYVFRLDSTPAPLVPLPLLLIFGGGLLGLKFRSSQRKPPSQMM